MVGICLVHSSPGWAGDPASPEKTLVPHSYVLPLSFEANQGQVDQQVKYLARGQGYSLFLTPGAAVLGLRSKEDGKSTQWLRLVLQGAATAPALTGEDQLAGRSNYFVGNNPAQWRTNIPTFARVRYQQVYPGVDLIYYGRQGQLENDFEVSPGSSPKVISWQLEGAKGIRIDPAGDLVMAVSGSEVRLQQPRAYQLDRGQQQTIPVRYRIHGEKVSFALGKYDRRRKLVIDPYLIYSTYLGGTGGDTAYSIVLPTSSTCNATSATSCNAIVAGVTGSIDFPTTSASYQPIYRGDADAFITKFNSTGNGVLFSTYLGGTGIDIASQIRLDAAGDIFVVGSTTSTNFPVTSGAFQQVYGGNQDAFLTELRSDGSALIYSTYIGGSEIDYGTALALDASGDVFVVGSTDSPDFPTKNPVQLGLAGLYDAFVTEVNPTGGLIYSTYLGGSLPDYGTGIAVDTSGNVYVSGYTYSENFPTQNALQSQSGGGSDIFITKFTPGSSALLFSTYLGGSSNDQAAAMIVDSIGNIYLTGSTESLNFPVTTTAYQSSLQGTSNAFITKVAPGGSALVFSTLFGGNGSDQATAMALDPAANIYITGFTQSTNFPQLDSFQHSLGTSGAGNCGDTNLINVAIVVCSDAFVAKFGPNGVPTYSSFMGGNNTDDGQSIAVDSSGAVYVAGATFSADFPVTAAAFQGLFQGSSTNSNAFVTKISPNDGPSLELSLQEINFGNDPLLTVTAPAFVTLTNEGSTALSISSITTSGDFQETNNCGDSVAGGGGTCSLQITFTPTSLGLQTDQITLVDNAGSGTQAITVTGNGVLTGGALAFSPARLTFAPQTVGTTSPNQTAVLINTGNQPVTITNVIPPAGWNETNNCGTDFPTVPASLNVGQTCTFTVSYSPTTTGSVNGIIQITTSNAVSNSVSLNLTGTGEPNFSLSSNARSSVVLIGSQTASFVVAAAAASTFTGKIVLSCDSGVTCNFNPSSIQAGGSSQLTVTGLSPGSANPLNFTVTGNNNQVSASVSLAVFFQDYSIAATPSGATVTSGNNAIYTITLTPENGFNQGVLLSCSPLPPGGQCFWNPPAMTLNGSAPSTSTLTIVTVAESKLFNPSPPRYIPPGSLRWILLLALMAFLGAMGIGLRRSRLRLGLAFLLAVIVLIALGVGCENYVNPININPSVNGTPAGTYSIVLSGTLANGSGVTRQTAVNLSVLP